MFLRFTITGTDATSRQPQGIFHAAWALLDSGDLTDVEAADLRDLLEWFNQQMPYPSAAQMRPLSDRAVFWFRPTAHEYLEKAWELTQLLRLHGLLVEVRRTTRPGTIVFSDHCQVAAVPVKSTF